MTSSTDLAIANFQEYLRIRTVQPTPDYDGAVEFLKKMADQLGLVYKVYECVPKKPVFVMTWLGEDQNLPAILLNSHIDVVPVFPECWKYDPFSAHIDEKGDIYARGTQDMKCVAIQYIEAIRRLKACGVKLLRTVHLTFVPDEEIGGADGMETFVTTELFKGLNIGFALDEGLANATDEFMVYYGERTNWWVTITCTGSPGHGSLFIENNAGEKLRKVLNNFLGFRDSEEQRLKSDSGLTIGDVTTVNLTKIKGGVQTNVVPSEFQATFDVRITPFINLKEFEDKVKSWCAQAGENVRYSFEKKSTIQVLSPTDDKNAWWAAFKGVFEKMHLSMKLEIFPAATDSRYIRQAGIPALGFSPMNNTPVLLHDHNEYLNSHVFLRGIDVYVNLITDLANVPVV